MDTQEKTSIVERLERLELGGGESKLKKFRLPRKGKVSNKKMKDGYITVVKIEDNHSIDFIKEKIIDSTIKIGDSFHAIDSEDVFFYKNKPVILQAKRKLNPWNPLSGTNETYGQKYVMARMEGDKIVGKKPMGWGLSIGAIVIVGIIAYALFTGG